MPTTYLITSSKIVTFLHLTLKQNGGNSSSEDIGNGLKKYTIYVPDSYDPRYTYDGVDDHTVNLYSTRYTSDYAGVNWKYSPLADLIFQHPSYWRRGINNLFMLVVKGTNMVKTPIITNFYIPTQTFGDIPFTIPPFTIPPPTSTSPGTFTYTSSNTAVATISGNIMTIVGAGSSTIRATQSETNNYNSGTISTSFIAIKVIPTIPTITNFSITTKTFGDIFTITPPTSNSPGAFTYTSSDTSVATISGNIITIIGVGSSTITATQKATINYTSGTINTPFQVNQATPTITNFSIPTLTFGDIPFTITPPTSNSSGTFSYTSSNTSVATISGNIITIIGAGTSTITATQADTTNYTSGTISTVLLINKATPTITNFHNLSKRVGDAPFTITPPTSNSPGAFTYINSIFHINVAIIDNKVFIKSHGNVYITAFQAATNNYNSGNITNILSIAKKTPTITNFSIPIKIEGDPPFKITRPTSNSNGGFITTTSSNSSVATISGNIITIIGAGTSTITVTQAESNDYSSGTVSSVLVVKKTTTITNFYIPTVTFGDTPFTIPPPTSNSDAAFTYTSSDTSVASISGNIITIHNAGIITITATQAATNNYSSGTISTVLLINQATPTISSYSIPQKKFGDTPFPITPPTSNSPGAFTYTSSDTSVATISGNIITIIKDGISTITATQDATNNYTSGIKNARFTSWTYIPGGPTQPPLQNNRSPLKPTISNFNIPTKIFGDVPFTITAPTSNSPSEFTYTSSNTSVATIQGNIIKIISPGLTIITAKQSNILVFDLGIISAAFQVFPSISTNPTVLNGGYELLYFMDTSAIYGEITNSVEVLDKLVALDFKLITIPNNSIKITKKNIS